MTSPPERRADEGVRIIVAPTAEDICREMALIGCMPDGIEIMADKANLHLVRLQQVPASIANIIKQESLAHGADAAVHWRCVSCGIAKTDVLLMGTSAQIQAVCAHLRRQPFGLPGTAQAILDALHAVAADARGVLHCGRYRLPLGAKTYIMGIINATPDSFSGDGLDRDASAVQRQAEQMIEAGADLLDIGGESTRPGAEAVPLAEELRRLVPLVNTLAGLGVPISVDTYKSEVAREAIAAGATMVNDISGLHFDPAMAAVAAAARVPVVVMHIQGTPRDMQQHPTYHDLMSEVCCYLQQATAIGMAAGIPREQIILDPGFGFGKLPAQNLELVRRLRELTSYGQPLLIGTSRKSTIGHVLGGLPVDQRLEGTAATVALSIANGADIVRVHDVQAMSRVARMADAIVRQRE